MTLMVWWACAHAPREPGPRAFVYRHEEAIAASPEAVWAALVDLRAYEAWNPLVPWASGEVLVGERLPVEVVLDGERRDFAHVVLAVEAGERFCWRDTGPQLLVAYGQRCRVLEVAGDHTVLHQELLVEGPLRGLVDRRYGAQLQAGIEAESAALRVRVEGR